MRENQIEKLRETGHLGSSKDVMWDGKQHQCCGSRRSYYHKIDCRLCNGLIDKSEIKLCFVKDDVGNEIRFNKHPKRKNNQIVASMYAMYQDGKSLEEIGKVYNKSRQSIYDLFKSRKYQLRSKKMLGLQVLDGFNFTLNKGGYLRGTVNKKRVLMHRYVWEKFNGKIKDGFDIHHLDNNRENNNIENLECLLKSEHTRLYSPHHNQYKNNKTKHLYETA